MRKPIGKWGVFVTRGQPFHIGHISVIEKALKENDQVLVVIGSADKRGLDRNPLSIETRTILFSKIKEYLGAEESKRLHYICLDDWSSEDDIPYESAVGSTNTNFEGVSADWGMYLYYNIVTYTKAKSFTLYYNDSAEILESWFPTFICDRIKVKASKRVEKVSSSEVRQALKDNNVKYLTQVLPYLNKEEIKIIQREVCI